MCGSLVGHDDPKTSAVARTEAADDHRFRVIVDWNKKKTKPKENTGPKA